MSDNLLPPFFGNPKETRRAEKVRKNQAKTYEDTWLDSFIKGFFGEEAPAGSVLEDTREQKSNANKVGQALGIATDVSSLPKALLSIPFLAAGALRKGGAKDLVAMHATSQPEGVAKSGYLDAPSLGITARAKNDYSATNPQFIFAANSLDEYFPNATLTNRDSYFANPRGRSYLDGATFNPAQLQNNVDAKMKGLRDKYGKHHPDLRLGQMIPPPGQTLSIASSPSFRNFEHFEKSPAGAATLRVPREKRESYWEGIRRDLADARHEYMSKTGRYLSDDHYVQELIRRVQTEGPDSLTNFERQIWDRAQRSPSAMAEMKILDQVDITDPSKTMVLLPTFDEHSLREAAPLRDLGLEIRTMAHLTPLESNKVPNNRNHWARLPSWVPDEGGFRLPPKLLDPRSFTGYEGARQAEIWNDWIDPGSPAIPLTRKPKSHAGSANDPFGLGQSAPVEDDTIAGMYWNSIKDLSKDDQLFQIGKWHEHGHFDDETLQILEKKIEDTWKLPDLMDPKFDSPAPKTVDQLAASVKIHPGDIKALTGLPSSSQIETIKKWHETGLITDAAKKELHDAFGLKVKTVHPKSKFDPGSINTPTLTALEEMSGMSENSLEWLNSLPAHQQLTAVKHWEEDGLLQPEQFKALMGVVENGQLAKSFQANLEKMPMDLHFPAVSEGHPMAIETVLPSGKPLQLNAQGEEYFNDLMMDADEYLFVMDDILQQMPSADPNTVLQWLKHAYETGWHDNSNWHPAVEEFVVTMLAQGKK